MASGDSIRGGFRADRYVIFFDSALIIFDPALIIFDLDNILQAEKRWTWVYAKLSPLLNLNCCDLGGRGVRCQKRRAPYTNC
jgi:hypothetical protein